MWIFDVISTRGKRSDNSRGTPRSRIEGREKEILTAAASVFSDHGVDGAKMAEIARVAGIAEGTLYLYYRNKQDLLNATVGDLWEELMQGADESIDLGAPALTQLEQLARYHLQAIISQVSLIDLTLRARSGGVVGERDLRHIRNYVRSYDAVIQRGIDRGELKNDFSLWQSRDVFYGALEYSAQTLVQRGVDYDDTVISNLISLFHQYSVAEEQAGAQSIPTYQSPTEKWEISSAILDRLDAIEQRLATLGSDPGFDERNVQP